MQYRCSYRCSHRCSQCGQRRMRRGCSARCGGVHGPESIRLCSAARSGGVGCCCDDGPMASVLEGLDPEQTAAVLAPRGPVCALAGAGTGKTRTITRRIAHLVSHGHVAPGQVLAVNFTARAAGEMRMRLRALGVGGGGGAVQARTFHAAALRQLKCCWPRVVGEVEWRLLDRKFAAVGQAASRAGAPTTKESVRDLAGEIEWAKSSLITPE